MAASDKKAQDQTASAHGEPALNQQASTPPSVPAAGAHAAGHLTNEDATPGSGALTSRAHASGKEVDGGAG